MCVYVSCVAERASDFEPAPLIDLFQEIHLLLLETIALDNRP